MVKDPIFFTPEVDHSMNIINETDKEEHSRMRRMLSFAFSTSNLLENEDVLVRRTNEFIQEIGNIQYPDGKKGFNIVKYFNYVTFNIMGMSTSTTPEVMAHVIDIGEMSFGDSFDTRLEEQEGKIVFPIRQHHS
jgi:hypothetical protein